MRASAGRRRDASGASCDAVKGGRIPSCPEQGRDRTGRTGGRIGSRPVGMPMSDDSIGHPVFGQVTAVPLPIKDGGCLFCRFVGSCNFKKAAGGSLSIRKKKGARPFQRRSVLGRGWRLPLATEKTLEIGDVFGISGRSDARSGLRLSVENALERSWTAVLQGRVPSPGHGCGTFFFCGADPFDFRLAPCFPTYCGLDRTGVGGAGAGRGITKDIAGPARKRLSESSGGLLFLAFVPSAA